jgi:hypothetical protein
MKNSPAKAKAAQMLKQIKGKGGVLKAELENVRLIRIKLVNLKTNCRHLSTISMGCLFVRKFVRIAFLIKCFSKHLCILDLSTSS